MPQRNRLPYSREELFGRGPQRTYRESHLSEIAFPLGGLGTGSVSLGGWGQLRDWELRNRPAKGRTLPNAFCSPRVYALNEEAGLLIGSWPHGERPGYAFWFTDEVWCGIEYQVASHLIYEGLVEEGLAIVKGVRDRHTGNQRNPWDEFECGHHYARSLASYALLLALSGFSYSAPEQRLGMAPRVNAEDFRSFFSVASGWGSTAQKVSSKKARVSVEVVQGSLTLRTLQTALEADGKVRAKLGGEPVMVEAVLSSEGLRLTFPEAVTVQAGQELRVTVARRK